MEKEALEKAIAEVWTLGEYVFDADKQCFLGSAEVGLCLYEVENKKYRSCDSYFFDGYEVGLSEEERDNFVFTGDEESVTQQAIAKFNSDKNLVFLGYPIVYTNIETEFVTDEERLFREEQIKSLTSK